MAGLHEAGGEASRVANYSLISFFNKQIVVIVIRLMQISNMQMRISNTRVTFTTTPAIDYTGNLIVPFTRLHGNISLESRSAAGKNVRKKVIASSFQRNTELSVQEHFAVLYEYCPRYVYAKARLFFFCRALHLSMLLKIVLRRSEVKGAIIREPIAKRRRRSSRTTVDFARDSQYQED